MRFIEISHDLYITSSFYDKRIKSVRILFASSINNNKSLSIIVDNNNVKSYKILIYDKCIKYDEDFDLKYGNIIINVNKIPKQVLVNQVSIPFMYSNKEEQYFLSVCITSLYNYSAELMLKQLIEIYMLLGVDHFTIYYSTASKKVLRILNKYANQNRMNLILCNRDNITIRMRNFGQYIKTNDCLYRYLGISEYVINTDIDEILIPIKYRSLKLLIKNVVHSYPNTTFILFSSKMFIKNESLDYNEKKYRVNYLKLHRIIDTNIFKIHKCCYSNNYYKKYIAHVTDMYALHTHYAWQGLVNTYNVPYCDGYSRHTRRLTFSIQSRFCNHFEYDTNLSILFPNLNKRYISYK